MPTVIYRDHRVSLREGESVLDGLLRAGAEVSSGCRSGSCKACTLKAEPGSVPAAAQRGLRPTERERGLFLACQHRPTADVHVYPSDHASDVAAQIVDTAPMGGGVVRVRLRTEEALPYRAGQFVALRRSDGLTRSYSLASRPSESLLELHVSRVERGRMSQWLHDGAKPGTQVWVRGPFGDCVYDSEQPDVPLLMVGVGTGMAPLWGVVREAVARHHRGAITLVEAAARPAGLYLHEPLQALARDHAGVELRSCALQGATKSIEERSVDELAVELYRQCKASGQPEPLALLCGDAAVVHAMRRRLFMAGLSSQRIFADAFVPVVADGAGMQAAV